MNVAALVAVMPHAALARDYGQAGAVFPVVETDLLSVIRGRLETMQASGATEAMNRKLAARTRARVERPTPVAGIVAATTPRSWIYDPTITVGQDLRDARGVVLVAAGARVNPLDTVGLRQKLIFLNADDPAQLKWALRNSTALDAKLILVGGSPFTSMKSAQRRFFFDQGGSLTTKLGIRAVPAVVEQAGRQLRIREIVLPQSPGAPR
jgi:conjugal transfer pilus assembly protein TraW